MRVVRLGDFTDLLQATVLSGSCPLSALSGSPLTVEELEAHA